ncbi:MAG: 50S ribosomal protein L22 [Planctomycetes bacterium]|nr:50S ribosomal protein L22 [Planctomycetota bacterium]
MPAQWKASHRFARISPRKARLVMDTIRGKFVDDAKETLLYSDKRAAYLIDRVLSSALANATQETGIDPTRLVVAEAFVNDAPRLKRWKAGPMGRVRPIVRRSSHIHVILEQK